MQTNRFSSKIEKSSFHTYAPFDQLITNNFLYFTVLGEFHLCNSPGEFPQSKFAQWIPPEGFLVWRILPGEVSLFELILTPLKLQTYS